jgi:hypothetical protein
MAGAIAGKSDQHGATELKELAGWPVSSTLAVEARIHAA